MHLSVMRRSKPRTPFPVIEANRLASIFCDCFDVVSAVSWRFHCIQMAFFVLAFLCFVLCFGLFHNALIVNHGTSSATLWPAGNYILRQF